jgi:hypothetical protein
MQLVPGRGCCTPDAEAPDECARRDRGRRRTHRAAGGWSADESGDRTDARSVARYLLAGSFAVFLAGLGTAAFIAGGDPQAQAPAPKVTPSVDVFLLEHDGMNGLYMRGLMESKTGPSSTKNQSRSLP